MNQNQKRFIEKISKGAINGWYTNKILPSITIAQGILESGWGQSTLAKNANNLFGIKAKEDWKGQKYKIQTAEYRSDGTKFYINAYFRKYKSWDESVLDHTNFFTSTNWRKENYKKFVGEMDYIKATEELQKSGYATSPTYGKKLKELIEKYNLYQYDKNLKGVNKMRIFLSVGHSILNNGTCTSAAGFVNEYNYNKAIAPFVKRELEKLGHSCDVIICPEKQFTRMSEERKYKLPIANSGKYDLCCELHLNASNGRGHGCEVYYYKGDLNGKLIADRYCISMAKCGFTNRGAKNAPLYMVNETHPTAVLLESFFCDNKQDCDLARRLGHEAIAKNIAYALTGELPRGKAKKKCVMYYKDGNKHTAKAIGMILGIPCFKDNGKELPKRNYKDYDILYVGDLGKDRAETCKIAFNRYLGTNFK